MLPANLPITVAFYRDKIATVPVSVTATWSVVADTLVNYVEESPCTVEAGPQKCAGKECPHKSHSSLPDNPMAWSPVEISDYRLDVNVRFLTLLVLDFDHLDAEAARNVLLALASYEHVRHTTHNHRVGDICFRAVLPLSRKVHANQWHRFLAAAVAYLGVPADPTCKNRSRFYYRPSHPRGAPHDAEHVRGRVLDVDAVLASAPPPVPSPERQVLDVGARVDWDLDGQSVLNAIDVIVRYMPPPSRVGVEGRRHPLALALAGMLWRAGATEEDARYVLYEGFRQGGSANPDARANVVAHTWSLGEDAAMTGFTRVCEILGEDVAREFGDYLTDAANEAFLRAVRVEPSYPKRNGVNGANGANGTAAAGGTNGHVAAPIDLAALRDAVASLATRRARSLDRDDRIAAVLLRRVLAGEPLARPGGEGDVETVRADTGHGVGREEAVRSVVGAIAFALPAGTPWAAVAEILRPSIAAMEPA